MGTGVARCRAVAAAPGSVGAAPRVWADDVCVGIVQQSNSGGPMLRYAAIFFVIAIIAAVFGFGGIAAGAAEIAKVLFFIFIVIFLVTLLMGVIRR
jgi:uncharacterized membrane protein YtjA (UPF0391 family)